MEIFQVLAGDLFVRQLGFAAVVHPDVAVDVENSHQGVDWRCTMRDDR